MSRIRVNIIDRDAPANPDRQAAPAYLRPHGQTGTGAGTVPREEDRSEPDVFAGMGGSSQTGAQGTGPQDQGGGRTLCSICRHWEPVDRHDLGFGENGDFGSCSLLGTQEGKTESQGFILLDDPHVGASLITRRDFSCAAAAARE